MHLVIFDIDGTLTRTNHVDAVCFLQAFDDIFGITDADEDWESYEHVTDSGIAHRLLREHLGRDPAGEEVARVREHFVGLLREAHRAEPERFAPTDGAREALRALPEAGWCVAIATGGWRASATFKLEAAGLDCEGLPSAFADDALARTAIMRTAHERAERRYARDAERVVYVGDATWDVRACAEMRLPFVGVGSAGRRERMAVLGARTLLADLADLDALTSALRAACPPAPAP